MCKERLFQTISVTTQVAISRRVHRYRLSLRDRQAARGREEESGGLRPLAWGGNVEEDQGRLPAVTYQVYIGKGNSRQKEKMWGKEMGEWLAEDTTALWCDHSTSY